MTRINFNCKTPQAAMRNAAKLLEREDWCQHEGESEDGAICVSTAIISVTINDDLSAWRALVHFKHEIGDEIIPWNDAPGRTKRQVLAALRKAAR